MYILFALIVSYSGAVSFTATETTSATACSNAKATAETFAPSNSNYVTRATYWCQPK